MADVDESGEDRFALGCLAAGGGAVVGFFSPMAVLLPLALVFPAVGAVPYESVIPFNMLFTLIGAAAGPWLLRRRHRAGAR